MLLFLFIYNGCEIPFFDCKNSKNGYDLQLFAWKNKVNLQPESTSIRERLPSESTQIRKGHFASTAQ